MDDLFLEDLGEKIGLQNKTMKIRGAFSSIIWKDPPFNFQFVAPKSEPTKKQIFPKTFAARGSEVTPKCWVTFWPPSTYRASAHPTSTRT